MKEVTEGVAQDARLDLQVGLTRLFALLNWVAVEYPLTLWFDGQPFTPAFYVASQRLFFSWGEHGAAPHDFIKMICWGTCTTAIPWVEPIARSQRIDVRRAIRQPALFSIPAQGAGLARSRRPTLYEFCDVPGQRASDYGLLWVYRCGRCREFGFEVGHCHPCRSCGFRGEEGDGAIVNLWDDEKQPKAELVNGWGEAIDLYKPGEFQITGDPSTENADKIVFQSPNAQFALKRLLARRPKQGAPNLTQLR